MTTVATDPRDYATIAFNYARDVVAGRVLACKWIIAACRRQLADLDRQGTTDFPYRFDEGRGAAVCQFIELMPHTKGKWARNGQTIRLEPWQVFVVMTIFAWVHEETDLRRFRKAYLCLPRKNTKSTLAAGIGNYMFAADGEHGAEVYSGATTEKQAWEVYRPARLMAQRTPAFVEQFGIDVGAKNMHIAADGSRFEPVIGKPGDGASPSCAIVDEYHEHETDALVDTMETGMGAREQPLMLIITTAGTNLESPCFALQVEVQHVLDGNVVNEQLFGAIWTIDDGDDWTSELALRKANPNYDISVAGDFLHARIREAVQSARRQNTIKTKHLNVWCTARNAWMNMEAWNAAADATLTDEQFAGDTCWLAFHLAAKVDLNAAVRVYRREIDGLMHYYAFGRYYLPEDRAAEPGRHLFQGWMKDNRLTITDGNVIDYKRVLEDAISDAQRFEVAEIVVAANDSAKFVQDMQTEGFAAVEIPQRAQHLSEPMKELEALVLSRRFHHDGNPVLSWMVSNVVVKPDKNEQIFPRKDRPESRIDGAVALVMGISRAMLGNDVDNWRVI